MSPANDQPLGAELDERPDAETFAAAEELWRLGHSVVTVRPRSKVVMVRGRDRGKRLPFRVVERALRRTRDAGIGIRMGRRYVTIDVDSRSGGLDSWRKLVANKALPPTAEARTGGGGFHFVFRLPRGVFIRCSSSRLGPGIDVKGRGGFIVVEPSVNAAGNPYRWTRHPREGIAMIPSWLLGMLFSVGAGRRIDDATRAEGSRPGGIPVGDVARWIDWAIRRYPIRAAKTRWATRKSLVPALLGKGLGREAVLAVVRAWWDHHFVAGACETDPADGACEAETLPFIDAVLADPEFRPSRSGDYHRTRRRGIELTPEAHRRIDPELNHQRIGAGRKKRERARKGAGDLNDLTIRAAFPVGGVLVDRICRLKGPAAFVEALAIQVIYHRSIEPGGTIKMTYDDIREIVASRHPEIQAKCRAGVWSDKQVIDYADLFIDRAEGIVPASRHRPAGRLSLLRRVVKGEPGMPSEFEVTGLAAVLELGHLVVDPEMAELAEVVRAG